MTKWLITKFVISRAGDDNKEKRLLCGRLSGTIGIILNLTLGLIKIFVGSITGSIAVTSDAINNLSDATASVITFIGFSMANRKSDTEHPFGHARYEYMTGAIVSALVIVIGVKIVMDAWAAIFDPREISFQSIGIILLIIVTLIKLWLFAFNLKLSGLIESSSLKATGIDSRNDAILSASTLAVILLFEYAGINIDAFVGLAVGVFIIISGLQMVKATAGPLVGQSPEPETVREIAGFVLDHKGVLGIHDLIVHEYGPGHIFVSVHIEVDSQVDIFVSHELIDNIEKEAHEKLKIFLVGHMDPLDTHNAKVKELSETLRNSLGRIKGFLELHDLRIVTGRENTKVIFDAVVSHKDPDSTFKKIEKAAQETLSGIDPKYLVVVNRDLDYNAGIIKKIGEEKEEKNA